MLVFSLSLGKYRLCGFVPLICFLSINNFALLSWWRHRMESFSALLALCAGNSLVTGEFPTQRPVTRSFGVFFELRLNKQLNKQSRGWWFETLSRSSLRHCNGSYNTRCDKQVLRPYGRMPFPESRVTFCQFDPHTNILLKLRNSKCSIQQNAFGIELSYAKRPPLCSELNKLKKSSVELKGVISTHFTIFLHEAFFHVFIYVHVIVLLIMCHSETLFGNVLLYNWPPHGMLEYITIPEQPTVTCRMHICEWVRPYHIWQKRYVYSMGYTHRMYIRFCCVRFGYGFVVTAINDKCYLSTHGLHVHIKMTPTYILSILPYPETKMLSFWRNFRHCMHHRLSKWQGKFCHEHVSPRTALVQRGLQK